MLRVAIRPFVPGDLALVKLQPAQRAELTARSLDPGYGETLWRAGPAFTAETTAKVLACAGLHERQPHHAHAWAFIGAKPGPAMLPIARAMRAALAACGYVRVDMIVQAGFCEGHRLAALLGFGREGRMRRGGPGGMDVDIYARVEGEEG